MNVRDAQSPEECDGLRFGRSPTPLWRLTSDAGEQDTGVDDAGRLHLGPSAARRSPPAWAVAPLRRAGRHRGRFRQRGVMLRGTRAPPFTVEDGVRRVSRRRAEGLDALLATRGHDYGHAPARHDQLPAGAMRTSCVEDLGRGHEPRNRRQPAARLARSFGLGLEPTCTAKSFAAERSAVMARAGDNQRCKLQLHRRGTYLYWHTLSAVPSHHCLLARTRRCPPSSWIPRTSRPLTPPSRP